MSGWGAVAQGVGSGLITRVHGRKARLHAEHMQRLQWQEENRRRKEDREYLAGREDSAYQRAVLDAQKAGLHPLFAMGGAGAASGMVGHSASAANIDYGDSGAAGFGQALRGAVEVAQGEKEDPLTAAQLRVLQSEANRNDAVAESYRASTLARVTQVANTAQDGRAKEVVEKQPSNLYSPGFKTPLRFPEGKTKMSEMEDYFGEPAEWFEGVPLYIRAKGQQIAEEYQDVLDKMFRFFENAAQGGGSK